MLDQSSVLLEAIGYSISLPTLFVSISRKDQCSNQLTERVTGGAQALSSEKQRRTYAKLVRAEGQAGILSEQMHTENLFPDLI